MFCGNCGANNPDDASVCGSCGAVLTTEEVVSENLIEKLSDKIPDAITDKIPDSIASKLPGGDKNKFVALGAIIGAAVVALALVIWIASMLLGGNGPKDVATKYIKASMSAKGGKTLMSLLPDEYVNRQLDNSSEYDTRAEAIRGLNDILEDNVEDAEDYYGKYKVKAEIRKVEDWKNSKIKEYNKRLDDRDYDLQIKDGADVKLRVTINGKDDKDSKTVTVSVIKVGGKWYMDFMNSRSVFVAR